MNRTRRKDIKEQINRLEKIREELEESLTNFNEMLEDVKSDVEYTQEEEEEALNNLPESVQNGDRGDAMQSAIDNLGYAVDEIDTMMTTLEDLDFSGIDNAITNLNEAMA